MENGCSVITDWKKIGVGLKKYQWIMQTFKKVDVSTNREFQKRFNHFYRIRQRTPDFYLAFYQKLEDSKNGECPTFGEILDYFWNRFQRIEASFSSKLIATVNPNLPVWDNEVLRNLGLKKPYNYERTATRLEKTKKLYAVIRKWYSDYLITEEGKQQLAEFDKHIPNSDITDTKRIDLILWQTR